MSWDRAHVSTFIKYVLSGAFSALFQIALLEVFVSYAAWEPVYASAIAFVVTLVVNFALQKFWSFNERDLSRTHFQMLLFACNGLISLGINTTLMYVFTYGIGLPYLMSQILTLPAIASESYLAYRYVIFKIPTRGN